MILRGALAVLCAGVIFARAAGQSAGASSLPATAPTTSVSPSQLPSANPPVAAAPKGQAEISWDGSTLQISATNAGLNRLLRDIAQKTGLRITGSAPDERIFGTYGPGRLDDVLSALLDGVSVNVLYVDRIGDKPKELVLTSRTGGVTPPSQSAGNDSDDEPSSVRPAASSPPAYQQAPGGQNAAAPASGGAPQTNGVRTPQEIFEQLQRLRSQSGNR